MVGDGLVYDQGYIDFIILDGVLRRVLIVVQLVVFVVIGCDFGVSSFEFLNIRIS